MSTNDREIFNPMAQASNLLSGGAVIFALFAFYVVFAP